MPPADAPAADNAPPKPPHGALTPAGGPEVDIEVEPAEPEPEPEPELEPYIPMLLERPSPQLWAPWTANFPNNKRRPTLLQASQRRLALATAMLVRGPARKGAPRSVGSQLVADVICMVGERVSGELEGIRGLLRTVGLEGKTELVLREVHSCTERTRCHRPQPALRQQLGPRQQVEELAAHYYKKNGSPGAPYAADGTPLWEIILATMDDRAQMDVFEACVRSVPTAARAAAAIHERRAAKQAAALEAGRIEMERRRALEEMAAEEMAREGARRGHAALFAPGGREAEEEGGQEEEEESDEEGDADDGDELEQNQEEGSDDGDEEQEVLVGVNWQQQVLAQQQEQQEEPQDQQEQVEEELEELEEPRPGGQRQGGQGAAASS